MKNTVSCGNRPGRCLCCACKDVTRGGFFCQIFQFQRSKKDALFCFAVAENVHVASTVHVTADMKCALERDLGLCCSHGNEGEALRLHSCHPVYNVEKCIPSFSMMEIHTVVSDINTIS